MSAVPLRSLIASSPAGAAACPGRGAASAARGPQGAGSGAERGEPPACSARAGPGRAAPGRAGGAEGAGPRGVVKGRGDSGRRAPPCGDLLGCRARRSGSEGTRGCVCAYVCVQGYKGVCTRVCVCTCVWAVCTYVHAQTCLCSGV